MVRPLLCSTSSRFPNVWSGPLVFPPMFMIWYRVFAWFQPFHRPEVSGVHPVEEEPHTRAVNVDFEGFVFIANDGLVVESNLALHR